MVVVVGGRKGCCSLNFGQGVKLILEEGTTLHTYMYTWTLQGDLYNGADPVHVNITPHNLWRACFSITCFSIKGHTRLNNEYFK